MTAPKPKPKERTIRAWAVICEDGEIHEDDNYPFIDGDVVRARRAARFHEEDGCAPHTVVSLTGKVKVRK